MITSRTFVVPIDVSGFETTPELATVFLVYARLESMFQVYDSGDTLEDALRKARKLNHRFESLSRRDGGIAFDA